MSAPRELSDEEALRLGRALWRAFWASGNGHLFMRRTRRNIFLVKGSRHHRDTWGAGLNLFDALDLLFDRLEGRRLAPQPQEQDLHKEMDDV